MVKQIKTKVLDLKDLQLTEVQPSVWRLSPFGEMRVAVHFIASESILKALGDDKSIQQACQVATLPGVIEPVLTMPDIHQGYGFPIGGVAAFHEKTGVVSPGGVGYDINCGVRFTTTSWDRNEITPQQLEKLINRLFAVIPSGVGSKRKDLNLTGDELDDVLTRGASWAVKRGFGFKHEIDFLEEKGCLPTVDLSAISERARERGANQLGTLGSGNHFLEIQYIDEIYDEKVADVFQIRKDQVVVSIHTGSRGLGYQVCSDFLETALSVSQKYGIPLIDRELASCPIQSPEGQAYIGAMNAAANFAFANRQIITHWVREIFLELLGTGEIRTLYDLCHNIAKFETFNRKGREHRYCVHRKGATRALPPGHPTLTPAHREAGQPVLVPGDMGRYSFLLVGQEGSIETSFASACHGAGREMSRAQAKKRGKGRSIERELEAKGIFVRASGRSTIVEEMPEAYKDAMEVVQTIASAGIAKVVARLRPLAVIKG